jgi:hypothetical protein
MNDLARKRLSAIAVVSIAIFALVFFWSSLIVVTFRMPQTGASATYNFRKAGWEITRVGLGTPAARAGLRKGDIVLYASKPGVPPTCFRWLNCLPPRLFNPEDAVPAYELAHPPELLVKRGSHSFYTRIDAGSGSRPYPLSNSLRIVLSLLVFTAATVFGTWLTLLRPGLMAWALFAFCVSAYGPAGSMFRIYFTVIHPGALWNAFINTDLALQLGVAGLPVFLLRFPNDSSPGWRRAALTWTLWTVPWPLFLLFFVLPYIPQSPFDGSNDRLVPILKLSIFIFSLGILGVIYAQARGVDRQRAKWVIVGVAAALIAAIINNAAYLTVSEQSLREHAPYLARNLSFLTLSLGALLPICVAYAIVKHRVIDVRFIASRGIIFGILLALLAVVFVGLDWIFTRYVSQSLWQIAIGMAVAFGLGWAASKFARRLVIWVDRAFFRTHYTSMTQLRELRFALERETRPEEAQRVVIFGAVEALKLGSAALFVPVPDRGFIRQTAIGWNAGTAWHLFKDDPIVRKAAHRNKPFSLQEFAWNDMGIPRGMGEPALAVPLISRHRLVALAVYGAHLSGAEIDPDETRLLRDLCATAALAFDQRITGSLGAPTFAPEETRTAR